MDFLFTAYRWLVVAGVIGAVIFVHELGHFLVARWCGVFVERFSIGFGPVLMRWRGRETEYALSAIPLGGYVKMKGQTDTPEVEVVDDDPRSYQNRPVWQRMAIISAGVAMNAIFAFVLLASAYLLGVRYPVGAVGTATPGMPAWEAGMRPGDRLEAVNGRPTDDYQDLRRAVSVATPKTETVRFSMSRPEPGGRAVPVEFALTAFRGKKNLMPQVGVLPASSLQLGEWDQESVGDAPAFRAEPALKPKDRIVAVDGQPAADFQALDRALYAARGRAVKLTVDRPGEAGLPTTKIECAVGPNRMRTLGLVMEIGRIEALQPDSPASRAVDAATGAPAPLALNDVIKAIDGVEDFDPLRLPDLLAAKAGQAVELRIIREGRQTQELHVKVVPAARTPWEDLGEGSLSFGGEEKTLLGLPPLGAAVQVRSAVRKVEPGSPAARANPPLQPGDVVVKAEFTLRGKKPATKEVAVDGNWPQVFWNLQSDFVAPEATFRVRRKNAAPDAAPEPVVLTAVPDSSWPLHFRGLPLIGESRTRRAENAAEALRIGWEETLGTGRHIYLVFFQLLRGNISPRLLSGPVGIGGVAYSLTSEQLNRERLADLFLFTAMLNVNLAVLNFMPIPILDGGHMVWLLYEAAFRRRPPERVVHVANIVGFFLLIGLMVYVLGLDIARLVGWA